MDLFNNLKNKYLELLKPVQQTLGNVGQQAQNFQQTVNKPIIQPVQKWSMPTVQPQVNQAQDFYQQQLQPKLQQFTQQAPKLVQNVGRQLQRVPDYNFPSPKIFGQPILNTQFVNPASEIARSTGRTIERIGQRKFLQGTTGEKIEDIGNIAQVLPMGRIASKPLAFSKEIQFLRNKLRPEDVQIIGKFAEIVETTGGKGNLGELGQTIHSLATNIFGKQAATWNNQKIKNVFDLVLQKIGTQSNQAGLGLSIKNIREGQGGIIGNMNRLKDEAKKFRNVEDFINKYKNTHDEDKLWKIWQQAIKPKTLEEDVLKYQGDVGGKKFGLQRFLNDYAPTVRESKLTNISGAVGKYNPVEKTIELAKGKMEDKWGYREVLGHESRHSIGDKLSSWLASEISDLKYKDIVQKVAKMPMTSGSNYSKKVFLEDNDELAQALLEKFTYENKLFKNVLPEVYDEISRYFNLRKQARSIGDLAIFYKKVTSRLPQPIRQAGLSDTVYAGRNGKYDVLKPDKSGVVYTTSNPEMAKGFGQNIHTISLKDKNILDATTPEGIKTLQQLPSTLKTDREIFQELKKMGYDGVKKPYEVAGVGTTTNETETLLFGDTRVAQPTIGEGGGVKAPVGLRQSQKVPQVGTESSQVIENQLSGKQGQIPAPKQILSSSEQVIPQGMKERKFVTTVRESKVTNKDVAAQVKGFYIPTANKDLISKAAYSVRTDYDFAKQRVFKEPLTAETNAMGQEIMRQSQNAGRFDEAIKMAELLARKGTEAGQSVQAFANWARLTPQGMLRYAQKEFLNANEKMGILSKIIRKGLGKQEVKFSPEDAKVITNLMTKANNTTDEVLRAKYIKDTFEYIGKKLPWGASDLLDEYRYNNMLSNPLTHLRNAVNNLQQVAIIRPATLMAEGRPIESIKYEFGALKALPDAMGNFIKSLKKSSTFGKMDVIEGVSEMRPIKPNRLGFLNIPSKAMEASDQFFRTLIKGGEMARGQTAEQGIRQAEYSLFRQGLNPEEQGILLNKIDALTKAVYQLRKVGLGWFIPFIRTPMNVAKQWIEYSPMGIVTLPGATNKRTQLAKTLLGSMVTAIGANVALEGRTTWAAPTDPKAKELFYASGKKPYSIKIGNKWVPMQTAGVFAWALGLPAAVKYYNDDSRTALTDSDIEKLSHAVLSLGGFWSNQTFVSGLGSFVKLAEGDADYSFKKNIVYTLGQLKPWEGLMRYVSTVIDPIYRKPSGVMQQLQADVPILTKGLPAYKEPLGEPSTRNITNYITPYSMGQEKSEYNELYQMRNLQLQNNAILNKQKKELESQANNPLAALAAEESSLPQNTLAQQRAKLKEDLVKQRVQMTGQPQKINNKYYYQNENGNVASIQMNRPIYQPKLSGQPEIDKLELQKQSSSYTSKISDIQKLYELNQLTAEQANILIVKLKVDQKAVQDKYAKPKKPKKLKKVSFKGIKAIKLKLPKLKKVKAIKAKKVKVYKMSKLKKVKKIKLT